MTIPNLITTHQKKVTVTRLQKVISVLNQAYKLAFEDVGEPDDAYKLGAIEYFNTYWAPYLKVSTICTAENLCNYKERYPFRTPAGYRTSPDLIWPNFRYTFTTPDGFLLIIFTGGEDIDSAGKPINVKLDFILADINAHNNPNRVGRDVFYLTRKADGGGIQPYGHGLSDEEINKSCAKSGDGRYCAEKIRRAGWQIPSDYPWK